MEEKESVRLSSVGDHSGPESAIEITGAKRSGSSAAWQQWGEMQVPSIGTGVMVKRAIAGLIGEGLRIGCF